MMHEFVWQLTVTLILVVVAVFAFIALKSGVKKDYDPIVKKAYRIRTIWFVVLFLVIATSFVFTLADLPYYKNAVNGVSLAANAQGGNAQVVEVISKQFAFEMDQTQFKAGIPVVFQVTSADVNHGFGIYDSDMIMLAQTQAMPDYYNELVYTFDKPGTYEILCLEYCGIAHHAMVKTIEIVE